MELNIVESRYALNKLQKMIFSEVPTIAEDLSGDMVVVNMSFGDNSKLKLYWDSHYTTKLDNTDFHIVDVEFYKNLEPMPSIAKFTLKLSRFDFMRFKNTILHGDGFEEYRSSEIKMFESTIENFI